MLCSKHTLRARLSTSERFFGELEFPPDEMRERGDQSYSALGLAAIPVLRLAPASPG